ncbi:MAG: hypothetical protein FJ404_05480 [Verrucomicrobia bacterium]|nr:hypothetical protein [Verrucomicrobiota bacterium]
MTEDRQAGIARIRDACKSIALEMMKIHPTLPSLQDTEAQGEILKALFEATKQVEIIKKRLAKLEAKDDSALL